MSNFATRPPYATDEPDSSYAAPAQRRPAPARPQQNTRSSAYDVYDNYLGADSNGGNRSSGVGAAFMNGDMSDSDDEDGHVSNTRKPMDPHHTPVSIPVPSPAAAPGSPNKHSALAAAVRPRQDSDPNPPPQYRAQPPSAPAQAAIAAPRPGYAAPIGALDRQQEGGRQGVPPGIHVPSPHQHLAEGTPSPTSPHPLQAPLTPIQPVFARPRPPKSQDVKFDGDIMRGDKEQSMLPKRGEKGDDFWRRFSMVVKDEGTKREKTSAWLRKTQNGTSSLSRWVWITGVILIIAAAGGIGLGWYMSHKAPDHYQPTAIGGSANESGESVKPVGAEGGATAKSELHVTPTNTVARRAEEVFPTALPEAVKIQAELPEWMHGKREELEIVKIEPDVPDWMIGGKKKRFAHNRVH